MKTSLVSLRCALITLCFSAGNLTRSLGADAPVVQPGVAATFQEGSPAPRIDLSRSPRARAVLEAAQLNADLAIAFDRGEVDRGKALARQVVAKLKAIEQEELKDGNRSGRSKLAVERGRVLLDYLGDVAAAKEALLDAVESDDTNEGAQRRLLELIDRETASARKGGQPQ